MRMVRKEAMRRVSAAALALVLCLGLLNVGLPGATSGGDLLKGVSAAGDVTYEAGTTYYDTGSMTVSSDWRVSDLVSALGADAVTVPSTSGLDELASVVDQPGGKLLADYKAGAPDGTEYRYLAKGTVAYDADARQVVLDWEVKAWPEKQHRAVYDYAKSELGVDLTKLDDDGVAKLWDSQGAFDAAAPKWASGGSDFTKWNKDGNTGGAYGTKVLDGNALVWSGSPNMMMAVSNTVPVKWGSLASGESALEKDADGNYVVDDDGDIVYTTTALRTAYLKGDDTGKMTLKFNAMGETDKSADVNINVPGWADVLPKWDLLGSTSRFETDQASGGHVGTTYMTGGGYERDIVGYLNANRKETDTFETFAEAVDGKPGRWVNTTKWTLPAFNTPGFFQAMFTGTQMQAAFRAIKDGDSVGYMSEANKFINVAVDMDGPVTGHRIYAVEAEAFVQPGGLWDGALKEDAPTETLHIGDTAGDLYYGRNEHAYGLCVAPNQTGEGPSALDKYPSVRLSDGTYLDMSSQVHAYHDGVPTHYIYTYDREAYDLYQANRNTGNAGIRLYGDDIARDLVSTNLYSGYGMSGLKSDGAASFGGGEIFVNTQVPMELRYQAYFDLTADYQRATGSARDVIDVDMPEIIATTASDGGRRTDVVPSTSSSIVDEVRYSGLAVSGPSYTLVSEVYPTEAFVATDGTYSLSPDASPILSMETALQVARTVDGVVRVDFGTESVKVGKAGTVRVVFDGLDTTAYDGKALVVRETIRGTDGSIAVHGDPSTRSQAITYKLPLVPTMSTSAVSGTGSKYLDAVAGETIIDTVRLDCLEAGTYRLEGAVYDKTVGTPVDGLSVSGEPFEVDGSKTTTMAFTLTQAQAESVRGHDLVVYEILYKGDEAVLRHNDPEDEAQTVSVKSASVKTLLAGADGSKKLLPKDDVEVVDDITYYGLVPGNEYKIISTFVDTATGETLKAGSGDETVVSGTFTASGDAYDAHASFRFTNMGSVLEGRSVTAFNELYRVVDGEEVLVVSERDLANADQTVAFGVKATPIAPITRNPAIDTLATSGKDGGKVLPIAADAAVRDEVDYKDLTPGVEYVLATTVFNKTAGKLLDGVSAETRFTPEAPRGKQAVEFKLDTTKLDSHTLVVYQSLSTSAGKVLDHADPEDTDQTLTVEAKPVTPSRPSSGGGSSSPSARIDTVAYADKAGDKDVQGTKSAVIHDEVSYSYFSTGYEYTVTGTLYDKTEKAMVPGVEVVRTFRPTSRSGKLVMEFTFDATDYVGHEIVVYETVSRKSGSYTYNVCSHKSSTDKDQTVRIVKPLEEPEVPLAGLVTLSTSAADTRTGTKTMTVAKDASISDTVSYQDVVPDKTYKLVAHVYDKATGKRIESIPEAVKEITPVGIVGGTVITIPVDTTAGNLAGKELVVVETLYDGDLPVGEHRDMNDARQTVRVPANAAIDTVATDARSGGKLLAVGDTVVHDVVNYWYLVPGTEYVLTAQLLDRETGELVEGTESVDVVFTPKNQSGQVGVDIPVPDTERFKSRDLVVVESLSAGGKVVCTHMDLGDDQQTVHVANVATQLTPSDTTGKTVPAAEGVKLLDSIGYYNLFPNHDYRVDGFILDTSVPGMAAVTLPDGTVKEFVGQVVAANTRTLSTTDRLGSFTMDFGVDTSALAGHKLVALEYVSDNGVVVARHDDPEDEKQTVTVRVAVDVQTGPVDDGFGIGMDVVSAMSVLLAMAFVAYSVFCAFGVYRRKDD